MWSKTLALAMISVERGLSLVHILLGLTMIVIGLSLGLYLISKIETEGKHEKAARTDAAVYAYAVSRNGDVDIAKCANDLKLTKKQVRAAILRLQEAKRVAVEKAQ